MKQYHNLVETLKTGPEVIKLFSCSTPLSTKFIMLVNVEMPTIVRGSAMAQWESA